MHLESEQFVSAESMTFIRYEHAARLATTQLIDNYDNTSTSRIVLVAYRGIKGA